MWRYTVEKSPPLRGDVAASISKNSVLPLMAAGILTDEELHLTQVPRLKDVSVMGELLVNLGAQVEFDNGGVKIGCKAGRPLNAPEDVTRQMRASFVVMGPLLARFGEAFVPLPGGCGIGARPVDLHIKGFTQMGVQVNRDQGGIHCRGKLTGAQIYLDYPSVGATENLLMAASLARGKTTLVNAAREPEIVDLARLINQMGGCVQGAGTGTITIEGCRTLHGTDYRPMVDRIEAGTYLYAAAITGGDVRVTGIGAEELQPVVAKLELAGAQLWQGKNWVRIHAHQRLCAVDIKTLPWPGFPTDLQSAALAAACTARGTSLITETVFENRFQTVPELVRMGASIRVQGNSAVVEGADALKGAQVEASDLRAGAALILAALNAEGKTTVLDSGHICRGYEDLPGKLNALGAAVYVNEQA